MDNPVVTELIQNELTAKNIIAELKLIENESSDGRKKMMKSYQLLEEKLGSGGASKKVASLLLSKVNV